MQPMVGTGRALRTVVVVPDLHELHGPVTGLHRLPLRLEPSARALYDFANPHRRDLAFRTILMEACSVDDLTDWLNRDALLQMWQELYLPKNVRAAWQDQHPELAELGAGPHVPSA